MLLFSVFSFVKKKKTKKKKKKKKKKTKKNFISIALFRVRHAQLR